MYRIELSPGEETAFRSIEELAVAIRRGVVTSKARIWHNASSKWLPIQFHPHYRQAAEMPLTQADLVAGPPVAPLSSLSLPDSYSPESRVTGFRPPVDPSMQPAPQAQPKVTPAKPVSPYHQPEPQLPPSPISGLPLIEPVGGSVSTPSPLRPEPARPLAPLPRPQPIPPAPRPVSAMKAVPVEPPTRTRKKSRPRKSSRRALRAALIGALLIGGAHLGLSATGALGREGLRSYRRLVAVPESPQVAESDSPRTVAAVLPTLRNSSVPSGSKRARGASRAPAPTLRVPAPTLGAVTQASLPMTPAPTESVPEIQAAPAVEIPLPKVSTPDSLSAGVRDTTGKQVLKGILKTVSGSAPASDQRRPKR